MECHKGIFFAPPMICRIEVSMASCWGWKGWTKKILGPRRVMSARRCFSEGVAEGESCPFCFGFSFKHHLLKVLKYILYIVYIMENKKH